MCWLSSWRSLLDRGFSEAVTASRIVGSIHRKEFRLVVYRLSAFFLDVRCCGGHTHVSIQGSYAKPSDTYTDGVALHIAHAFRDALRLLSAEEILEPVVQGHESVMSNEVMLTSRWSVVRDWFCKQSGHIGILEMSSAVSNLVPLSRQHVSVRFCHLVDSAGALSKGRSPSRALKTGAVCVCSDLYPYPGWIYTPTRLNVPMTRPENNLCVLLRRSFLCAGVPLDLLRSTSSQGLRKLAANWVRLVLLAAFLQPVPSLQPVDGLPKGLAASAGCSAVWLSHCRDVDVRFSAGFATGRTWTFKRDAFTFGS